MLRPAPTVIGLGEADLLEYTEARKAVAAAATAAAAAASLAGGSTQAAASAAPPTRDERIGLPKRG